MSCFFGALVRPLELTVVKKDGKADNDITCNGNTKEDTESRLTFGEVTPITDSTNKNEEFGGGEKYQRRRSVAQVQDYIAENKEGTTEFVFQPKQRRGSRIYLPPMAKSNSFYDGSIDKRYSNENPLCPTNNRSIERRYSVLDTSVFNNIPEKMCLRQRMFESIDFEFWKNPAMLSFLASRYFGNFALATFYMFLPSILVEHQLTMAQASLMLTAIGVPNMFSRIMVGAIMDHPRVDSLILNAIGFTVVAILLCVFAFYENYTVLMVLAALMGINFSPYQVNTSIALGQMLPTEKVASGAGKASFIMGLGSITGPVLAGYIFDNTGDHRIIVFVQAFAFFLGGIACLLTSCINARRNKLETEIPK